MIKIVDENNFESLLGLMRMYQEFYGVKDISDKRNRDFFSQFRGGTEQGIQFLYYDGSDAVAFATIYYSYASSIAAKVAIMSDLFTLPDYRNKGIGTSLINHCVEVAKNRGCKRLQWLALTANGRANKLYKKLCSYSGDWRVYAITT